MSENTMSETAEKKEAAIYVMECYSGGQWYWHADFFEEVGFRSIAAAREAATRLNEFDDGLRYRTAKYIRVEEE